MGSFIWVVAVKFGFALLLVIRRRNVCRNRNGPILAKHFFSGITNLMVLRHSPYSCRVKAVSPRHASLVITDVAVIYVTILGETSIERKLQISAAEPPDLYLVAHIFEGSVNAYEKCREL